MATVMQVIIIVLIIIGLLAFAGLIVLLRYLFLKNYEKMRVDNKKIDI